MNILIVGANGQIARHLIKKLSQTEHIVTAMLRSEEQMGDIKELGAAKTVLGDLEGNIAHAFAGIDTVVFTAGSGGHTGADKTMLIDLWGAIKTIDEAERQNIKRFIMVSAKNTDNPEDGPYSMRHYYIAKKLADDHLRRSKLNYTIIRPGRLVNEPETGQVLIQEKITESNENSITREDVAGVIVKALSREDLQGKTFELLNGSDSIRSALDQFVRD
ncbi:SDR family oxidoreductase [Peribacillus saganii]|uniref:SDR family oxidoreductase n=1 Tax=Peribacillus saganii TaxID=2303992 RepID=A0A372LNE1_9BACI|nr:SDR family oxidoreductase [Peribacillus saganii]RFU67658.1 SDR family oxidoreductase [Peribacillus saganii]